MAQPMPARPLGCSIDPGFTNHFGTNMADNLVALLLQNNGVFDKDIVTGSRLTQLGNNSSYTPYPNIFGALAPSVQYRSASGFQSSGAWGDIPGCLNIHQTTMTIVVKVMFSGIGASYSGGIISRNAVSSKGFALGVNASGGIYCAIGGASGAMYLVTPNASVTSGVWYQVAATTSYSAVNGWGIQIYIDGAQYVGGGGAVTTAGCTWTAGSVGYPATPNPEGTPLCLGTGTVFTSYGFGGTIAYAALYQSRPLIGADICTLDTDGLPITGGTAVPAGFAQSVAGALPSESLLRTVSGVEGLGFGQRTADPNFVYCSPVLKPPTHAMQRTFEVPATLRDGGPNRTGMGQIFPTGRR